MKWSINKDAGVAGDNDPPASPAINGPGFSWHKLPQQKQTNLKNKSPKLVVGAYSVKPNALFPNPGISKFDAAQERDDHGRFTSEGPSIKSLFKDNLGYKRSEMPQIPDGKLKEEFLAGLKKEGVKVQNETVEARSLKPTQKEFNEQNIEGLREAYDKGEYKPTNRILVSKDNRVLDGHHRWAMLAQKNEEVEAVRIGLPMKELMPIALKFDSEHRVKQETKNDTDVKKWEQFEELEPVVKGNENHDPNTGQFLSGSTEKLDLYKKRADETLAADKAMRELQKKLRETRKDDSPDGAEPAEYNDGDGRPKWMQSPGQGGKDPVYRSQKPGTNGNVDALFSKNVNKNPPTVQPIDQDSYYIW